LKEQLAKADLPYLDGGTHIVPVIIGDATLCKALTDLMLDVYNIYVQPINYPTVPKGTERIRLTPSAHHNHQMIDQLVSALIEAWDSLMIRKAA
jgi:5-aminolevulinate synthase